MRSILIAAFAIFLIASCSKGDHNCGCVPPPFSETKWKMTKIFGGIATMEYPLNDAQKNSVLTIRNGSLYTCTNLVTGETVNGTYSVSNYSSIYGDKPRFIFTPSLPILPEDYVILVNSQNGSMEFGDNNYDGVVFTFSLIQ